MCYTHITAVVVAVTFDGVAVREGGAFCIPRGLCSPSDCHCNTIEYGELITTS